jgi:predicted phage tail protein
LIAPAAGGTSSTSDVTFTWHSPDGDIDLYALRYSSSSSVGDDGGLTGGTTVITSDESKVVTGLANGRYYWQVRALDLAGNVGDWTRARMLDVAKPAESTKPAPPKSTGAGATGGVDEATEPTPTATTEPTPEPSATEDPEDSADGGSDAAATGDSDAAAGDSDDPGFPFLWIIIVIVVLAGGGFLIRFLIIRRG